MTKTQSLLDKASQGLLRARDLDEAGISRATLCRLCERGLLERVDRGLYRLAETPLTELSSLAEVAKRVPNGTICLLSALEVHELTSEAPHAVWLMIDTHARIPKLNYPPLEIVRASGPAHEHGVEIRVIEGVSVRITSPAKTVADCFRYRRHVGLEVALAALRDFLRKSRGQPTDRQSRHPAQSGGGLYSVEALTEAARADRVSTIISPYLEALL